MNKLIIFLTISALLLGGLSACAWMGRMAGKTVAASENIIESIGEGAGEKQDSLKDGYEQGYRETRKKQ